MTFITEDAIRELATFQSDDPPVTSCYLEVDGRRFVRPVDYEAELDRVLRGAKAAAAASASVAADLARIEEEVRGGIDRSRTRALAFFSCAERGLWEKVAIPLPVRSRLVVASTPVVGPLESALQEADRIAVLLVDKQRARMLVLELGELLDRSEVFDELPRDYDSRGERERGEPSNHVEALTAQHVRHAADVAFQVLQDQGYDRLYLGVPDALWSDLESHLHAYVRERLGGRVSLSVTSSFDEVRAVALDLEADIRRAREQDQVERLRAAVAADGRAVAGLRDVLGALGESRVERMLVSDSFAEAGWACPACGRLDTVGRSCPACGAEMEHADDLVEVAIERLLLHRVPVTVCVGNADLDVLGRIGAFLHY